MVFCFRVLFRFCVKT